MTNQFLLAATATCFSFNALADVQSYYCAQNNAYIQVGMSQDQVLAACGQPLNKQQSNQPLMEKKPVLQLMYNNIQPQHAFSGAWSSTMGINNGGAQLEFDILDNKISSLRINGLKTNATNLCSGTAIQVSDPVNTVYNACGRPSVTNQTYLNQPVSNQKPEIWTYQAGDYAPSVSLTILNGQLQSIN